MMELYQMIIFAAILLAWIISVPYLKRFKIYQFSMLLFFSFAIGILLSDSIQKNGLSPKNMILFILLIGGTIYQASRFYKNNLADKS